MFPSPCTSSQPSRYGVDQLTGSRRLALPAAQPVCTFAALYNHFAASRVILRIIPLDQRLLGLREGAALATQSEVLAFFRTERVLIRERVLRNRLPKAPNLEAR